MEVGTCEAVVMSRGGLVVGEAEVVGAAVADAHCIPCVAFWAPDP